MTETYVFPGITEDTEFSVRGCAVAYQMVFHCDDWAGASVPVNTQAPDGTFVPTGFATNSDYIAWLTIGTGTYQFSGLADLGAPLYVSVSAIPLTATDSVIVTNLTEPYTFQLQGGQYGIIQHSLNDDAHVTFNFLAADAVTWVSQSYGNGASNEWWFGPGTYQIDPGDFPVSMSIIGTSNTADESVFFNGITEDVQFQLKGAPLFYQIAIANATWDNMVYVEAQAPDGAWVRSGNQYNTNTWNNPGWGPGTYRLTGVSTLNSPLYMSIVNVPLSASDQVIFNDITEVTDPFQLRGGQYGMINSSADITSGSFDQLLLAPDGVTWLASPTGQNSQIWQWFGPGTYKIDPTGLTDPLTVSITGLRL